MLLFTRALRMFQGWYKATPSAPLAARYPNLVPLAQPHSIQVKLVLNISETP